MDLATLQTRLLEAELALHKLLTGTLEVKVEFDTIRTTYNAGDINKLRAYIEQLKAEISAAGGATAEKRRALIVDLPGSC